MKKFNVKRTITLSVAICLIASMLLCVIGCGGKSGTVYKYENTYRNYTDTYILFDDGTYKREYKEDPQVNVTGSLALETGTWKSDDYGSVTFYVEGNADREIYAAISRILDWWLFSSTYHGRFTDDGDLYVNSNTYEESGTMVTSGN